MFVPERKPGAHQVAASQDKKFTGCNVFVESGCDCRFWKNHFDTKMTKLRACGGWPEVIDSVNKAIEKGEVSIGIVDRDFREYVNDYAETPDNVFISDDHDVEMMIIKAEGIDRVINNYDADEHIQQFEGREGATVLEVVLSISDRIGILKLIDRRDHLNFKLRKRGKKTEFDLPCYEKFLDRDGHFVSVEKMIDYLTSWSIDNKHRPTKERDEIIRLYNELNVGDFDTYKLSSGHDVTYLIAYYIRKHVSGEMTDKEEIEKLLRASYTKDSFVQTQIFAAINTWCVQHQMTLLK